MEENGRNKVHVRGGLWDCQIIQALSASVGRRGSLVLPGWMRIFLQNDSFKQQSEASTFHNI